MLVGALCYAELGSALPHAGRWLTLLQRLGLCVGLMLPGAVRSSSGSIRRAVARSSMVGMASNWCRWAVGVFLLFCMPAWPVVAFFAELTRRGLTAAEILFTSAVAVLAVYRRRPVTAEPCCRTV